MPRTIAITWLDLIMASLLILCGAGIWAAVESAVPYVVRNSAPDKREFLFGEDIRFSELKLKNAQEELDATRKNCIEQRLVGRIPDQLSAKISGLEMLQIAAEKKVADVRRQAIHRFEHEELFFQAKKRILTPLLGVIVEAISFLLFWGIGSLTTRRLQLKADWRVVMSFASIILAPVFGYQTAGVAGAVGATGIAVFLVSRL